MLAKYKNHAQNAAVYYHIKLVDFSHNIIPLAHCSDNSIWDDVYSVIAVKFGRGFLIHIGMSLDEEREYKIVLDIIRRLGLVGYEMLAKSYPSS